MIRVEFTVDGHAAAVEIPITESLSGAIRRAGVTAVKEACAEGECGSCSVVLDGAVVCACLVPAAVCSGREVTTGAGVDAEDLADALAEHGAVQCGFCTPGIVVAAAHHLERWVAAGHAADRGEIAETLSGNLCRCTGYLGILAAVEHTLAERLAARP